MVIESFRAAMASILFSGDANSRPRVVVVSSINPGEGKSFVTANLAATLGESGHKVLIIDADMRKPQQGEIFNVPNDRGLSTILAESPEGEIQTMEAFGDRYRVVKELAPGASAQAVLDAAEWPRGVAETVVVVGHQPTLGRVAASLMTGHEAEWTLKKGGIWWFQQRSRAGDDQVVLRAATSPDLL